MGEVQRKNETLASGGEVSHLESGLRMRFAPRSSGQITSAFGLRFSRGQIWRPVYQTFQKLGSRQGRRRHL